MPGATFISDDLATTKAPAVLKMQVTILYILATPKTFSKASCYVKEKLILIIQNLSENYFVFLLL